MWRWTAALVLTWAGITSTACDRPQQTWTQQQPQKTAKPPPPELKPIVPPARAEESNIVRVNKIFEQFPWLSFTPDGTNRVEGFKCVVYLEGPDSPRGVFGTGTIVVSMYRLDRDRQGREIANEVYSWVLPREEAYGFRSKEYAMLGWGYGLRLKWGDNVKVEGKPIAIVVKYVRDDGRVISSSRKVFRVPLTGMRTAPLTRGQQPQ